MSAAQWMNPVCPRCGRRVQVRKKRFTVHYTGPCSGERCRMSDQMVPVVGMSDADHELRAEMLTHLAWQVQDADPAIVWDVLTCLPADELQRLLVFALAAIPVGKRIDEIFAWVHQLPVAKAACEERVA